MENLLALDLGTTALKCALHDLHGNVIAKASVEYELITLDADSVEMEVETYWQAFKSALGSVLKNFSDQLHSYKGIGDFRTGRNDDFDR